MVFDEVGAKKAAAEAALHYIHHGMAVGLGTGTTAGFFIEALGRRAKKEKMRIECVCTSISSELIAKKAGLKVVDFEEADKVDIAVDGADQIDSRRNLLKGYGGALAREKVVDYAAEKFIIVADERKLCEYIDKRVPVEALPFTKGKIEKDLAAMGASDVVLRLRNDGEPYMSDNGMWIWDAEFGKVSDPHGLERRITEIPGVLESGLFTHRVWKVLVANGHEVREI